MPLCEDWKLWDTFDGGIQWAGPRLPSTVMFYKHLEQNPSGHVLWFDPRWQLSWVFVLVEWCEKEKALALFKCCSTITKTSLNYQHCFQHKSKTQYHASFCEKINSTQATTVHPDHVSHNPSWTWAGLFRCHGAMSLNNIKKCVYLNKMLEDKSNFHINMSACITSRQ